MKVERSEDGETDVTDNQTDGNQHTGGEREAECNDTVPGQSVSVGSQEHMSQFPPTVTKEPFKISEALLESLADS